MSPPVMAGVDPTFELTFINAPIGMALVAADGSWLRANQALCDLLGRPERDLLRLTFQDLTHPDDLDRDLGLLAELGRGGLERYRMEKRYLRADGDVVWADLSVSVVRRPDGSPAYYISQIADVTERRRMAAIVARREREYRMLAEQSTDVLARHAVDGTILFASAATRTLLGYEPEELLGTDYRLLVHPDDLERLDAAYGRLDGTPDVVRVEARVRRRDGRYVAVETSAAAIRDAGGQVVELQSSTRDITERLRQEARHRTVVEAMAEGVMVLDPDGRVTAVNAAAARMLERAPADLIGRLATELDIPLVDAGGARLPAGRLPFLSAALDGEPCERLILGVERRGRDRRWATLNARPILQDGAVTGVVLSFGEITALVRAEAAAERRAIELERSNTALERFAYVASHDLSEPLRVMGAYADMLERRYADVLDDRGRRYTGNIAASAERMRDLIDGLLAFSRVRSHGLRPERFPAVAALDQVLADLSWSLTDAGATVTADPLPEVHADRGRFCQLLQNLVSNAVKFRHPERPPVAHVGVAESPSGWAFTVRDNGIGIDPAQHDRVFELFQRLHTAEEHPGSGLGLAICKEIVDAHGGRIEVDSAPGAGTAITFTIPRDPAADGARA